MAHRNNLIIICWLLPNYSFSVDDLFIITELFVDELIIAELLFYNNFLLFSSVEQRVTACSRIWETTQSRSHRQ